MWKFNQAKILRSSDGSTYGLKPFQHPLKVVATPIVMFSDQVNIIYETVKGVIEIRSFQDIDRLLCGIAHKQHYHKSTGQKSHAVAEFARGVTASHNFSFLLVYGVQFMNQCAWTISPYTRNGPASRMDIIQTCRLQAEEQDKLIVLGLCST